MKEQVTDISKMLQNMAEEMRLMRETINQQYAEIAKLNRNIESLKTRELPNWKIVCPNMRVQIRIQATAVRLQARNA